MAVEIIKYSIKSVGHSAPEPERQEVQPPARLCEAFNKLKEKPKMRSANVDQIYVASLDVLEGLEKVTVDEVHSFLLVQQAWTKQLYFRDWLLGNFVSAAYNVLCDEEVIVFDVPLQQPQTCIARCLREDKVFVNKSNVLGRFTGESAKGVVINYGFLTGDFGFCARRAVNYGNIDTEVTYINRTEGLSSVIVNLGEAKKWVYQCQPGLMLNFGVRDDPLERSSSTEIRFGEGGHIKFRDTTTENMPQSERMQKLQKYVYHLRQEFERGRNDISAAITAIKALDKEKIERDIKRIIEND